MAFFCPIFGNRSNKAAEYEDSDYFSVDAPRSLYPTRSLSALHNNTDQELDQIPQGENLLKDDILKPNTKISVTNDFDPTVDDEIDVKKGDVVTALYRDQNWVYIVKDDGEEGFIPQMYCSVKINAQKNNVRGLKAEPKSSKFRFASARARSLGQSNQSKFSNRPTSPKALENINRFLQSLNDSSNDNSQNNDSEFEIDRRKNDASTRKSVGFAVSKNSPLGHSNCFSDDIEQKSTIFVKKPQGHYVALYQFEATVEDDVSIEPGDMLLLLNKEDPDWFWVKVPNGSEGFVPSNYIVPFETDRVSLQSVVSNNGKASPKQQIETGASISRGCELLVIEDVTPEAVDDLQLKKGDWIFSCQSLDSLPSDGGGWLWGFCPRTQRYGFVRRSATQLPTATVL